MKTKITVLHGLNSKLKPGSPEDGTSATFVLFDDENVALLLAGARLSPVPYESVATLSNWAEIVETNEVDESVAQPLIDWAKQGDRLVQPFLELVSEKPAETESK